MINFSFMVVDSWTSICSAGLILEPVNVLLQRVEQEAFAKVNIMIFNLFSVVLRKKCQWFENLVSWVNGET